MQVLCRSSRENNKNNQPSTDYEVPCVYCTYIAFIYKEGQDGAIQV